MSLCTHFLNSRELYEKSLALYIQLESEDIYLDDIEVLQIETQLNEIYNASKTEFYNCFRTTKREDDGSYTLDVLFSKKETYQWLEENKDNVYIINYNKLNEFWDKYPNGVIYFG